MTHAIATTTKITLTVGACLLLMCCAAPSQEREAAQQDEVALRQWFDHWIEATTKGDLGLAQRLIADDAVFLVPGVGKMDKASFAAAATASDPNTEFDLDSSIQEIKVLGDYAWLWSKSRLGIKDKRSGARSLMAGDSLSVLRRSGDGWVVIREANTLVAVPEEQKQD